MITAPKHLSGLHLLILSLAFLPLSAASSQIAPSPYAAHAAPDSSNHTTPKQYWRKFAAGFATSIIAHEAGHVGMAFALGAHPYFGLDHGKPTVYSGIDASLDPGKQFLFASAGLDVQAILDEAILDVPHDRGSALERGVLAGGLATAYFYATLGRNAGNSDITYMAQTSSLSRTKASLIYASVATIQAFRIAHDGHYADFFIRPGSSRSLSVGLAIRPEQPR